MRGKATRSNDSFRFRFDSMLRSELDDSSPMHESHASIRFEIRSCQASKSLGYELYIPFHQ